MSQPAGNWFLIAIVAGVLAGCAGDKKAEIRIYFLRNTSRKLSTR
jgi:hypothetical protein